MNLTSPVAALKGQVLVEGESIPVCIRPSLANGNFDICNFWPDESLLTYEEVGPHIEIEVADLDFISLVAIGTEVEFPSPDSNTLDWYGRFSMLKGRPACDSPSEQRLFERLSVLVLRMQESTKFVFDGIVGKRRDAGNWPETLTVSFWFEVPDDALDQVIVGPEANRLFRKLLQGV